MRARQRLVVLAAALAAGISLWLAAAPLVSRVLGRGEALALGQDVAVPLVEVERVDLAPVLAFAPFGRAEGDVPEVAQDEAALGLTLLGITKAVPESGSRAMIAGGEVAVASYGVGAEIRGGVVLMAVFDDHVVVEVGGQEAVLSFASDVQEQAQVGGAAVDLYNLTAGNVAAEQSEVQAADVWLGQLRAEIMQDAPGLLRRLGLEPGDEGYVVSDAASDVVLQAGLQPGDVLRRVNGAELGDPAADVGLFDDVASAGRASVSLLRDGKTLTMTFPLR